jgi:hypothetical protein
MENKGFDFSSPLLVKTPVAETQKAKEMLRLL